MAIVSICSWLLTSGYSEHSWLLSLVAIVSIAGWPSGYSEHSWLLTSGYSEHSWLLSLVAIVSIAGC